MHLKTESTWSDDFLDFMSHDELPLDWDDRRHMKVVKKESIYALSITVFHEIDNQAEEKLMGESICRWNMLVDGVLNFDAEYIFEMRVNSDLLKEQLVWPEDSTVIYWGSEVLKVRWGTFLKYFPNLVWASDEWAYVARPFDSRCLWIGFNSGIRLFERERI